MYPLFPPSIRPKGPRPGIFALVLFTLCFVGLDPDSNAATVVVRAGGTGDGSSWESPLGSVQAAIDLPFAGSEIWVASGTYNEHIQLTTGTSLFGGFLGGETQRDQRNWEENETILMGDGASGRVVTASGVEEVLIDGFTILNGVGGVLFDQVDSGTLSHCIVRGHEGTGEGTGIAIYGGSPTITDCLVTENVGCYGAGLYGFSTSATVLNSVFSYNSGCDGGGLRFFASTPYIQDCTMSHNDSEDGGGATLASGMGTMVNCVISDNTAEFGAGLQITDRSCEVVRCTITRNRASYAAGVFLKGSNANVTGCLITENTADYFGGAGVYVRDSSPTLVNCTIAANQSTRPGVGLYGVGSSPRLTNCILWNPGADEIVPENKTLEVTFSCVQGGFPGNGNILSYPLFEDPDSGDWRLQNHSPCIDSGTESGNPFNGPRPDMGALESPETYEGNPGPYHPELFFVHSEATPGGDGSSWDSAFTSIGEALFRSSASSEIWVGRGTYFEGLALEPGLRIYGGFTGSESSLEERVVGANPTIVDATGLRSPAAGCFGAEGVTINGFWLTHGHEGIYLQDVQSATVSDCSITASFYRSPGEGRGILCDNSSPTVIRCLIADNSSTGVHCQNSSNPILRNCLIVRNEAFQTSAVFARDSIVHLNNCTIASNSATDVSPATLRIIDSSASLSNCILWNELEDEIHIIGRQAVQIEYSLINGGWQGLGNIEVDPEFSNEEAMDYRLLPSSPCTDAGSPGTEFNDGCRPPGLGELRNDMGAYGGPLNCGWPGSVFPPTPTPTPTLTPTPTATPFSPADLEQDNQVNSVDLIRILKVWNESIASSSPEDLYDDEMMNLLDLALFQKDWKAMTGTR